MESALQSYRPQSIRVEIPEVHFTATNSMRLGGKEFEIDPDSKQARVLEFFFGTPDGVLKREQLLALLYEDELAGGIHTIHFDSNLWTNGHQVLSRLRRALGLCFEHAMPHGTEWLPFSHERDGWILYKLPGYGSDGAWHS